MSPDVASDVVTTASPAVPLESLADMLIGSLLASHRVPAAAAAWTLMLLADHPEMQRSIADQVRTEPGTPPRSTLTRAVVLEALRLYPATWLLARYAPTTFQLGGHEFPPRHHFLMSPYVIHRDPDVFPEPLTFRPERWGADSRSPASYLPFGDGERARPGRHLAVAMLGAVIETIARTWTAERRGVVTPDPRTTLLPAGLRIRLVRRPAQPETRVCPT